MHCLLRENGGAEGQESRGLGRRGGGPACDAAQPTGRRHAALHTRVIDDSEGEKYEGTRALQGAQEGFDSALWVNLSTSLQADGTEIQR